MSTFGQNVGYVDEQYARYLADPQSVSEAWRDFFEGYRPVAEPAAAPPPPPAPDPVPEAPPVEGEPLRGTQARIVENMHQSLGIPTATSVRTLPVKLLDENRRVINLYQGAAHGAKISFTHLIAWAIVRALERHPDMNAAYAERDGVPYRIPRRSIHLGIAVDTERKGERVLVVPNLKDAASHDFPSFVAAYDDLIARARTGKLAVEDFQETTVSITNPGTVGTSLSVPRLMSGQGTIVGVGAIGFPTEFSGMSPDTVAGLGLSQVMTLTSTYDHRIIQGAESGAFLATLERLILGDHEFYQRIFADLSVVYEPVRWSADRNPVASGTAVGDAVAKQAGVLALIRAYRVRGHLSARLDPLGSPPLRQPELEIEHYGLSLWDLDRTFHTGDFAGSTTPRLLREITDVLRTAYCGHIGVEFMHIQEPEIRRWIADRVEAAQLLKALPRERQARILDRLIAAEAFERFLHTSYVGQKRFSLEGAETLVPMLDVLLDDAADVGIEEAVIGMAHRGRLNILSSVVGKSYAQIFREFEGDPDPGIAMGSGDVKYHLGSSGSHRSPSGAEIRLTVASNPSHLEAVDPVVEGMVRGKQDRTGDLAHVKILPLLLHGDAAFAGQGVVAETLNLSQLNGYRTGGTVHVVVNNQIGFTTAPVDARSSPYATDVARTVQAPIFHVNGDRPEHAVRTARLALAFRNAFKRDVVIDLVCYRRWGHNEGDDPSYTNPVLYKKIEEHRSVRKLYTERLLRRGDLSPEDAERSLEDFRRRLQEAFDEVKAAREEQPVPIPVEREGPDAGAAPPPETAVSRAELEAVLDGLERTPPRFRVHEKLGRRLARRRKQYEEDAVDWALAEALAFGSLVRQGVPIRLSGEDSGRGTFSQRHANLADAETGASYTPLANLSPDQARFRVYDSLLSEFAVLGFDYGYSVTHPESLVLWEAQFGDFVNGAQVILDQFVFSAEEKWGQTSGIVLLLPHGYEGQGPEHSSARVERFLQSAARQNLRVAVPSTPAQYFHLLRLQALDPVKKPLVVLTPKSLLRLPAAVSPREAFEEAAFAPVLDDPRAPDPSRVRRLVLCSGKLWYDLDASREKGAPDGLALARLERPYPFPADDVAALLSRYDRIDDLVWAQEEPRNMGTWSFFRERLGETLPDAPAPRYAGRARNPSPATGSSRRHQAEQDALVADALGD